ncbi:MAG: DNA translocase FtsK [Rickettsiales bacterium]|nr:MAG: DNA translocase FtsK [Rickettsiales bacterium]
MRYIKKILYDNKFLGMILLLMATSIFLSLISYDKVDPSFNLITDKKPNNLLYYFGSYLSDILLQLIGYSAFIIPLYLLTCSYQLFHYGYVRWALLRFICIICAVCLLSIILNYCSGFLSMFNKGGLIGNIYKLLPKVATIIPYPQYFPYILSLMFIGFFMLALGIRLKSYVHFIKMITHPIIKLSCKINIAQKFNNNTSKYNEDNAYYGAGEFEYLRDNNNVPEIDLPINDYKDNIVKIKRPPTIPIKEKASHGTSLNNTKYLNEANLLPSIDLLADANKYSFKPQTQDELKQRSEQLIKVLSDFGVKGTIQDIKEGPVVTMYEFEPAAGTKSSRVIGLADDIARSLSAVSTRIAVIPGRNALGIELPNKNRMFFCLKELVTTPAFRDSSIALPLILGKDLSGAPMIVDLAKMPHLLVAGTTGSGKSVAINAMIMSLLYKYTPEDCRMIMIDPKMLELSTYDNIPHLLTPVVTEPGKAIVALKWAVKEMENRYRLMSHLGVRSIANYNIKLQEANKNGQNLERKIQTGFDPETGKPIYDNVPIDMNKMPFIVVIVDEMADLMLVAGKDIETSIQRLAQMARAAGIHIIMATQRPSVDIITGVIKANFPSRISFKVTSKIDSRTILGEQGSEQLLGMGDMLYMGNSAKILRVHGPFVDDSEVSKVTDFLRSTGSPDYVSAVTESLEDEMNDGLEGGDSNSDIYTQAVNIVKNQRKASISYIQRCLRIGYNRAASLVEEMEKKGVLSPPNHSGKREILLPED